MRIGFYVVEGVHELSQALIGAARATGHVLVVRNSLGLVPSDFESELDAVLADAGSLAAATALYATRSVPGEPLYRPGRPVIALDATLNPAETVARVVSSVLGEVKPPPAASTAPAPGEPQAPVVGAPGENPPEASGEASGAADTTAKAAKGGNGKGKGAAK